MAGADRTYFSGETLSPDALRKSLLEEPAGAVLTREALPPGLFIVQNALTADVCHKIVDAAGRIEGEAAKVLSRRADAVAARNVDTRKTEHFAAEKISPELNQMVRAAYLDFVARHYRVDLEWFEKPMVLRYKDRGEYHSHADAYNWMEHERRWVRVANRDYSLLIYLNEDFSGGELEFKYLNFKVTPRQGMLVAFPSDWRYAHAAQPVTKGVKFSIVSFAAARGTPRIDNPAPINKIPF